MKLFEIRQQQKQKFLENGIDQADLDFIIAEVLGIKRTEILLVDEITEEQAEQIISACDKRIEFVPVEKIFHKSYFFGLEFCVDDNVLSPRPETELLVETAVEYIKQNNYKSVLDLCTGSGCIAVSIKKNVDVDMTASDISSKALNIAKKNAQNNNVEIDFVKSDMFEKIEGKFDLVVSNPPYIDSQEVKTLDREVVEHDPKLALDGGEYGLKYYNIIHENIKKHLNDSGMLILEIGDDQKDLITALYNDLNFVECKKDYSGNDRIMVFKK